MSTAFPTLFSPIKIGPMELKNRIALAPMANYMSDDEGSMTIPQIAFLERRARGGAGLLILGSLYVQHPVGRFGVGQLGMYDDKLIPGYCQMVDAVHAHGAKVAAQLHHAGRATSRAAIQGQQPVAPSPIVLGVGKYLDPPRELSKAEIQQLVQLYADAARRCKAAGFDGIEIHMAHGYLPCQFMSPFSNKRSDEYGGDVYGRTRFPREILQAVKVAVGEDLPVWCRIVGDELQGDAGLQLEDMKVIAKLLIDAGAEAISVSRGMAPYFYTVMNYHFEQGCMVDLAADIKGVVDVPVFTAGRITEPAFAEGVLREGRADMINLGRALICDPDWANKAAAGTPEDIRPCIGCNIGCHDPKRKVRHTLCLSNAECGREGDFDIVPTSTPKKVLLVGGGPAGLEAARVARQRGHHVTLVEKNNYLGGQLHLGAVPVDKGGMDRLIDWWVRQAERAGVQVKLNKEITAEDVRLSAPDVVVLATGGRPMVPPIPGIDQAFVVTAHEVLAGTADVGENVVVLGGGQTGAETAELLALQGRRVTVVEMLEDVAMNVPPDAQFFIKQSLEELGVQVLTSTLIEEIGDRHVLLSRNANGNGLRWRAELGNVDTVVLAAGIQPERTLAEELEGLVSELYVIGDASTPGNALDAVHEAASLGREI
jgi:2,4-dienoyl-CoA reductase-like NADH-dependent reductase (Old Yellow Enzyme family)/thioredoxin reductase